LRERSIFSALRVFFNSAEAHQAVKLGIVWLTGFIVLKMNNLSRQLFVYRGRRESDCS
jgi:hypothetical protein